MAFSVDLRESVMRAVDAGMRPTEAEKVFNVCRSVIYDWKRLREKTNSLAPKINYQKGHSHKITDWKKFEAFVEKHKCCTSAQMRVEWEKVTGISISESPMLRALHKIGYTSKKKHLVIPKQTKKSVSYSWKKSKI